MAKNRRSKLGSVRRLRLERLEPRRVLAGQLAELSGALGTDLAVISGEGEDPASQPLEQQAEPTFQSAQQLEEFLAKDAEQRYERRFGQSTWHGPWYRTMDDSLTLEYSMELASATANFATADYSQTNVQVQGVDEGDIVRTDGRYLYTNGDGEVVIIDTQPEAGGLQIVSRVEVEGRPLAMYLTEGRLTIISNAYAAYPEPVPMMAFDMWMPPEHSVPNTVMTVLDVSVPADPQVVGSVEVEGDFVDSRMMNDTLYLVSGSSFYLPAPEIICSDASGDTGIVEPQPADSTLGDVDVRLAIREPYYYPVENSCVYETREEYWDRIGDDLLNVALPNYATTDADGTVIDSDLLNAPQRTYRPTHEQADRLISITAIDVSADRPGIATSTAAPLGWTNLVYMSPQSLYLVGQTFDGDVTDGPSSEIYRFALGSEDAGIDLAAEGLVPGWVLNQFSLDEHDGLLRIVTQQGWRQSSESALYVLQQTDDRLDIVGSVEDLAPGERLYSVRFVQDRAFVVTFGPTGGVWYDPLFTIDLSQPTDPQVQGELEIPGFSNYLQLIDGDFLIGLGRNANETNGRSLEPQVSLYDVSDFDNPQLDDRLSFGDANGSWSEAFSEHLAVSYFPEYGILAVPLSTWIGYFALVDATPLGPTDYTKDGLWVFQIDPTAEENQIRHVGTIEHASEVRRSLRIENRLYSISNDGVTVHAILDPTQQLGSVYFGRPARDDRFTVDRNSQDNVFKVMANDWVPAGVAPWTITTVADPEHGGSVTIGDDGVSLLYTPGDGFIGWDSIVYTITGGNGGADEATVRIHVERPDHADRMTSLAKQDLADRLQVAVGAIDVVMVEDVDWPDGCLGLGDPETACTTALQAGYRITFAHGVNEYVYHTDLSETVELAETRGLEPMVQIRLEAVDEDGLPLSIVEAGQSFTVQIIVDDLRDNGSGVFATYVDILYPHRLAEVAGEIVRDRLYSNGLSGNTDSPGLIDEVGGFAGSTELGLGERLVASIPFLAKRGGPVSLVLTPADGIGHDALLYGTYEQVSWSQVTLVGLTIDVLDGWQNVEQPTDINEDGYTTALDALHCINELNTRGSRKLERLGPQAAQVSGDRPFARFDVNGDGDLTPQDALTVVNILNSDEHALAMQEPLVRPLVSWVDWQSLETEVAQAEWASLAGIGLPAPEMLDLSHKIFAQLDAGDLRTDSPNDWEPMGAEQVRNALPSANHALHAQATLDRVILAADRLEESIDSLDLHAILPGVAPDVDLDLARRAFRDRFFAEISASEFLEAALV